MRIINTFISDQKYIPEYTKTCLSQARKNNPSLEIDFICRTKQDFFDDLQINWIPQESLQQGNLIKEFNSVCLFNRHSTPQTTYPSPDMFWHRTAERIFYIEEYARINRICDFFHFENDVLIYYPLEKVNAQKNKITVTAMSETHTTFAFCFIPSFNLLNQLCKFFIYLLGLGEHELMKYGYDHISEMSLLNIALKNCIVETFDTIESEDEFVFDPGSYGQFLGGTNNGHSKGFVDYSHYIGKAIIEQKIRPCIYDGKPITEKNKIFNLHVHSKKLESFV